MTRTDQLLARCGSWDDFWKEAIRLEPQSKKGLLFERLTQLYLLTQPEYETQLKHVWNVAEVPKRIRQRLNLPATDEGIDLIAETREGEYWAIQCKFRQNIHKRLTVDELSTFTSLAFVTCRNIALGIVAHTCDKPVRKHKLLGNTVMIGLDRWLEIDETGWKRIRASLRGRPVRLKPRSPRPHQKRAIKKAVQHFVRDRETRGRLIMPCGTGKSLTAFWIAQAVKARTIVVAVPSLALIKQSLGDWMREYLAHGQVPDWLCVCSDETTGKLDQDKFLAQTYDVGVETTTKVKEIAAFLSRRTKGPKIVFTTYQSGSKLAAAARRAKKGFDFALLDEAHKTVGVRTKSFAALLFEKNIKVSRRLFMTATERVLHTRDDDVLTMDDEAVYGKRFFMMSFKEAIEADPPISSDYRIVTLVVDDSELEKLIKQNRLLSPEGTKIEEQEAQSLAAGVALRDTFRRRSLKHAISFHRSIRAASDFSYQQDALNGVKSIKPKISTFHISSKKTSGERAMLLKEFRQTKRALMTNARCLTEGVDIPSVDCVLFADPKQSVIDIVQAAGRALRPYKGKKYGYILLPVVVPKGADLDAFLEGTAFRQISNVIAALSTQDERIAEQFRLQHHGSKSSGKIVEIDVRIPVGLKIDVNTLVDRINTQVWSRVGRANWRPFEDARAYAHSLGLKAQDEWNAFAKSGARPPDIPSAPDANYRDAGWTGYGDWLGTGAIAKSKRVYRPFKQTRAYARSLGLKSSTEWNAFAKSGKRPVDIPAHPDMTYHDKGWTGSDDWLGKGWRPFKQARTFARSLGLKGHAEWAAFRKSGKRPVDIPARPDATYSDKGWTSWGDWLGTGAIAPFKGVFRPFKQAREYARSLGLKSATEWQAFSKSGKRPVDIPAAPHRMYRDKGWTGSDDWLGKGWRPFKQARTFARSLRLKGQTEWKAFTKSKKRPFDIPAAPYKTYRDKGWITLGDWLGTGTIAFSKRVFRPFKQARAYARSLGLKSGSEWRAFAKSGKLPVDIPADPYGTYRDKGWKGIKDWLGTK